MVDLHCHILPGLDDGPATMEESMVMAESAIADGITHLVATPHSSNEYSFDFARVRQLRDELQATIGDRLTIATGCDFHLNPENLGSLRKDAPHYCINQRDFLLLEFNQFSIPPSMDQTLHQIQLAGVQPVITHPERNGILRSRPERLKKWVRQGCFAQGSRGALTGGFGAGSQQVALRWIGEGLDRKSTRLNSSHSQISYAVFCLKKKNTKQTHYTAQMHTLNNPHILSQPRLAAHTDSFVT